MATLTDTTPAGVHEAHYAHTTVSFRFGAMLRAAWRAIGAEQEMEGGEDAGFDPALSAYMSAADEAWAELDAAVEAVLHAGNRRTADVALKRVATIWRAVLRAEDRFTLRYLAQECGQDRTLFRGPGHDAASRAVNDLLEEAEQGLAAFFALDRVGGAWAGRDDEPDPDPDPLFLTLTAA